MIMEELRRIAGKEHFTRADLPASGPLTVCEAVGRPWVRVRFARTWRIIATKAGIPANIQNRDSRPGAATEVDIASAPREKTQRLLGHSRGETMASICGRSLRCRASWRACGRERRKP